VGKLPDPIGLWARFKLWLRRHWRPVVVVVVVVAGLVTAGLIWFLPEDEDPCGGSGVREIGGECVGVTDGTYEFHESFAGIENRIRAENARVSGTGNAVTIALLDPLTVNETSADTVKQVRYELEGAYTAQYRMNHTGAVGDRRPLVRLVLANWGSHEMQWRPVVEQLEEMVDDPEPLVAVVGMQLSTVQTEQAANHLSQHNIPMASAIATAERLNYGNIPGLVRAAPPNSEYIAALVSYFRHHPDLNSTMTVYDTNSDLPYDPKTGTGSDLFTRSLREEFDKGTANLKSYPAQGFVGKSGPTKAPADLFSAITANICAVQPTMVLYAGREGDFGGFLESLENRACPDTPLTVVSVGADFGELRLRSHETELREKNLTIVYATENDAQGWAGGAPGTPRFFKDFYDRFTALGFDPSDLDDGSAISTHDALLIAAKAARLATRAHPDHPVPNNLDVLNQVLNLNSLDEVPGASGQLSFSFRGTASGNPGNKPIPVIEVPSTATEQTPEVYHTM